MTRTLALDDWLVDLKTEKERVKAYLGLVEDFDLFRLLIIAADQTVRKRQAAGRKRRKD